MRRNQNCYAGPLEGVAGYLQGFIDAGASQLCLRFCGDHESNLERVAPIVATLRS